MEKDQLFKDHYFLDEAGAESDFEVVPDHNIVVSPLLDRIIHSYAEWLTTKKGPEIPAPHYQGITANVKSGIVRKDQRV